MRQAHIPDSSADWLITELLGWPAADVEICSELKPSDSEKSVSVSEIKLKIEYKLLSRKITFYALTIAMSFSFDSFFVVVKFVVSDRIKRILCVRCFVNGCIMLIATLNDALRGGTHQYNMIAGTGYRCVLNATRFVPSDTFQNVRLWSGRNFICSPIVLYLFNVQCTMLICDHLNSDARAAYQLLKFLKFFWICAGRHKLHWILDSNGRWVRWWTVSNPLMLYLCTEYLWECMG